MDAEEAARTKNGVLFGCHVDLADDEEPDGCVIDYGEPLDCVFGFFAHGRPRRSKWTCKYWRPVDAALSKGDER